MRKIFIIVTLLVVFAGAASGHGRRANADPPIRYFINNVPFTPQLPNFCGPASLSSILGYWRVPSNQRSIADDIYDKSVRGTNGADMLLYSMRKGMHAVSFDGTPRMLKELVSHGFPVIVLQDNNSKERLGHYRIVVGYNDSRRVFILRDDTNPRLIKLSYKRFKSLWYPHGDWAMLVSPTDRTDYLPIIGSSNPVVHMDLALAYLHEGKRTSAEKECRKALTLEPGNHFTKDLLAKIRS